MRVLYLWLVLSLCCVNSLLAAACSWFSVYQTKCENNQHLSIVQTVEPRFSWQINSTVAGFIQSAYSIEVASSLKNLNANHADVWRSGKVRSSNSINVPYGGKPLIGDNVYFWRVKVWNSKGEVSFWSSNDKFYTALLSDDQWGDSRWIAMEHDSTWMRLVPGIHAPLVNRTIGQRQVGAFKMPQFRKEVNVDKRLDHAILYISGMGHFDCFLNGEKIGDNFLDPGWTKYDNRALYVAFDVTGLLRQGQNVLSVMLGNGFYNIPRERYFKQLSSYGAPKMRAKLKLVYDNGDTESVESDSSWKCLPSPIVFSSIFAGEDYDANLEHQGWMRVGFDDKEWGRVLETEYDVPLTLQKSEPLKVMERMPVVRKYRNSKGYWIYDLGQNFSGIIYAKIKSNGVSKKVIFRPCELLDSDSTANQSASGGPYYFAYTTDANVNEHVWRPQFSYYGFRYIQLEGAEPEGLQANLDLPQIVELYGLHTRNSADETGRFHCSNPMINDIHQLIDWSMKSNLASVLTDCPHREKLGWLEVLHLMQNALQYRYDLAGFYNKVIDDMKDAQAKEGFVPTIAPEYVVFADGFENSPEWGSASVMAPWNLYRWYGDKAVLKENYELMRGYVNYLNSRADNYIVSFGLGDWFDIGPNAPGYSQLTSRGVTATAMFYQNANIVSRVARILGHDHDADKYYQLAEHIKREFNKKYYNDSGFYDRNSQTANAITLCVGLVADVNRGRVFDSLCNDIISRGYALTAGDVGYRYVLEALTQNGADSIVYKMNTRYDTPGYGWQLANGATALTESWQAYGFVSNNHCMLGHLMEWLYAAVGGITQSSESVAFKQVVIDPRGYDESVNFARTSLKTAYGDVVCNWRDSGREFNMDVEIPANSTALIYLPTANVELVRVSGLRLADVECVNVLGVERGKIKLDVGSGKYRFKICKAQKF